MTRWCLFNKVRSALLCAGVNEACLRRASRGCRLVRRGGFHVISTADAVVVEWLTLDSLDIKKCRQALDQLNLAVTYKRDHAYIRTMGNRLV